MTIIRPGMGTECSSGLIASLIGMIRPRTVVEIGAGDSTQFITSALQQAYYDWRRDKELIDASVWTERTALLDPAEIPDEYQPRLITIDDFTAEGSSAEEVWTRLCNAGIDRRFITFVQENFFALKESVIDDWGPIDIAWIDAGTPADDVRFVTTLWNRIVPGGYLILHEPFMTTTISVGGNSCVRKVRSPVWEEIISRLDDSFELITIPEDHKYRQSGVGLVRKRSDEERYIRLESLQSELIELGEIPIRSDYLPVGIDTFLQRMKHNAKSSTMTSSFNRSVYAAIVLGAPSISDIVRVTRLDAKSVSKAVSRLQSIGLIHRDEDGLKDIGSAWDNGTNNSQRPLARLSDKNLESDGIVQLIAGAFRIEESYSEAEVSTICKLFTEDFSRLRRFLVDSGVLLRSNGIYTRSV